MNWRRRPISRPLAIWSTYTFVVTILLIGVYTAITSSIRAEANQPQVQIAEDIASQLHDKIAPSISLPSKEVDIEHSLAPFVMIFDSTGKVQDSSGKLNGQPPSVPYAALTSFRTRQDNRITWQPKPNTQIAAVITYYRNDKTEGYVLAGRNLREVRRQQSTVIQTLTLTWALLIAFGLAVASIHKNHHTHIK